MAAPDAKTIINLMLQSVGRAGDESSSSPEVKNPTEAAALFAHAMMLAAGFRLVGFQEEDSFGKSYSAESTEPLPKEWNSSSTPSFRYAHTQSSLEYLIKVNRMGSKIVILAMALQDDKTVSFDIVTKDYFSDSFFPFSRASGKELKEGFISKSRILDLSKLFKISIIQRLIPGLNKAGFEEIPTTVAGRDDAGRNEPRRPEEPYPDSIPRPFGDDPLRYPRPRPLPGGEQPPGFDDEYELLRGPRGGFPPRNPLSIGEDDLNPPGLGPHPPLRGPFFGEGGMGGGYGSGGGMHPTPDHPMFGGRGGGQGIPDPRAPPGARYDPTGPWDETPPNLRGPRGPGGGFGGGGGYGGGFGGFGGYGGGII